MSGGGGGGSSGGQPESLEARRLYQIQGDLALEQSAWDKAHSKPALEGLLQSAEQFDTPARQQQAAGVAQADVGRAFGMQQQSHQRDMMRYGVNPNSGRFAGLNQQMATNEALARAGAGTAARRSVEDGAFARQQSAVGLASGQGASAMAGLGSAASGFAGLSANAANANAQSQAGIGQLVGTGLTIGAMYMF